MQKNKAKSKKRAALQREQPAEQPEEILLRSLGSLDGIDEQGSDLEQVAADAVVRDLENGGGVVLIDGNDALGILHAGLVLDGAGDAQSNIDLGVHGLAGLADLQQMPNSQIHPSR